MKTFTKFLLIPALLALAISCSKDDDKPIAEAMNAPDLIAPEAGTSLILDPANPANPALTVVWNHAGYDVATQVNYTVEVALSDTGFATPVNAGTTSNRFLTWTVAELNGAAVTAGLSPFVQGSLDIRVKSSLGVEDVMEMISNVVSVNITPYTTELPRLYVVGSFQLAGGYHDGDMEENWDPDDGAPLAASAYGATDFEGFVYINEANANYKFLPTNVDFSGDYGDTGLADGAYSGTLEQENEVNCGLPAGLAGYYLIRADTEALTYNLLLTNWAITGSATALGWPAGPEGTPGQDIDMVYDPVAMTWSVTLNLTGGQEFKFRANDAWSLNFGTDSDDDGSLNEGGPNFAVAATGNYTVTLDLSNPRQYTYSIVQN